MASVAKWLRQRIVIPPFVGSSPIVRPQHQLYRYAKGTHALMQKAKAGYESFSAFPNVLTLMRTASSR